MSQWKKELEGRVPEIFAGKNHAKSELALKEKQEQRLERKVGQLVIEKEFLEKATWLRLGLPLQGPAFACSLICVMLELNLTSGLPRFK